MEPIELRIVNAAIDYTYGVQDPVFAEDHGGVDALYNELVALINEYQGWTE